MLMNFNISSIIRKDGKPGSLALKKRVLKSQVCQTNLFVVKQKHHDRYNYFLCVIAVLPAMAKMSANSL